MTRAGEIGASQRVIASLQTRNQSQQGELDRRAEWAMGLERDVRRANAVIGQRDKHIAQRETEHARALAENEMLLAARTEWAVAAADREAAARDELRRFGDAHALLQNEFDERTRWAKSLDADLSAMRSSSSWRLTRPLRFFARKLRATRTRLGIHAAPSALAVHAHAWQPGQPRHSRHDQAHWRRIQARDPDRARGRCRRAGFGHCAICACPHRAPSRVGVIPVYNKIDYSVACLRSIAAQSRSRGVRGDRRRRCIERRDAETRLGEIDGIHVLRNASNLGFVGSCNAGAAIANGEFLYFLNNDTVVTAGWLDALLRCFDEEADAGLVGAKLVYPDGRLQEAGGIVFRDGSGWNYGRFDDPADPRYNFRREADYCSGAAILIRRDLFERLGGFDSRYAPAYYEDTDLAFCRARRWPQGVLRTTRLRSALRGRDCRHRHRQRDEAHPGRQPRQVCGKVEK